MHIVDGLEQIQVEELTADGHLHLIEGIFQHIITIEIIDPAQAKCTVSTFPSS